MLSAKKGWRSSSVLVLTGARGTDPGTRGVMVSQDFTEVGERLLSGFSCEALNNLDHREGEKDRFPITEKLFMIQGSPRGKSQGILTKSL